MSSRRRPRGSKEKKKKKKKDKDDISKFTTDEMKQLRANLRIMRDECINEKKMLNDFQQQKEKIEKFWTMEKEKRDVVNMQLRNKLRQKQDLEEKQAFELKLYKQKVKHLLHEQQSHMTDVRIDGETALDLLQVEQRAKEHESQLNIRNIKVMRKEMELAHLDLIKSIKQGQEQKIMTLRQEYERKAEHLKQNYEKKMKTVREACDQRRKSDVQRIENRKGEAIYKLMVRHKTAFEEIKEYYSDITRANLELIKTLKEDVGDMKETERGVVKEVRDIQRENKRLSKPLRENTALVEQLEKDRVIYDKEKVQLRAVKSVVDELEEQIRNKRWEREVLEQKYERLVEERDALGDKLKKTIYDVQQRIGFKNLLLERKIEAMSQDLEKTESALAEVLASTNLQPEIIGEIQHNLEDVLMTKNKAIQRLEDQLAELKRKYAQTVQIYEDKLLEYDIPVEELGFTPVRAF